MKIHWLNHRKFATENDIIILKVIPGVDDPVNPVGKQVIIIIAGYGAHFVFEPSSPKNRKERAWNKFVKYGQKAAKLRSELLIAEKRSEFYRSIWEHLTKNDEEGEYKKP